jgi:hypothetical protein
MREILGGLSLGRGDLPDGFRSCKDSIYVRLLAAGWRYRLAHGFLSNIFQEMEPTTVEAFKQVAEQGAFPLIWYICSARISAQEEEVGADRPVLLLRRGGTEVAGA